MIELIELCRLICQCIVITILIYIDNKVNDMSETSTQQLVFGVGSELYVREEISWQQEHVDIVFSLIILITGIFQYVLRKRILPVS